MKVRCYSVISGKLGERLYNHIVYDDVGFSVGKDDFFSVKVLGKLITEKVSTYKGPRSGLKEFDLEDRDCRNGVIPKTIGDSPVVGLLFLQGPKKKHLSLSNQNRLYTNVRVPMSDEFWREISRIERSEEKEYIKEDKKALKDKYEFDFNIENSGCRIILPEEAKNSSTYLIAMSANSKVEWVLSRKSKYPNAYRIECDAVGNLKLIDTRKQARQVVTVS